jgi:hypothetical protein
LRKKVAFLTKRSNLFAGGRQEFREGDGAEDEQAEVEPEQHAEGGPAHEQTQPPKHFEVSSPMKTS